MRSFFRAMLDCHDVIYEKRDRAAADAYSAVEKFITEARYSSYKKANELCIMKLGKYSEEAIAAQLGISVSTVRTHASNVSMELYRLFGTNFFDMLSNYAENRLNVESVLYRLKHQNTMAVTYVLPEVISAVKERRTQGGSYELEDCGLELDFLRRYSRSFLEEALKGVSVDKLLFLIDVLDSRKGTPAEWHSVLDTVIGKEGDVLK